MSNPISIALVAPASLDADTFTQLLALGERYFDLDGDWFARRLRECDRVVVYRDETTGRVCGSTTLDVVDLRHEGVEVRALVTGAVILDRSVRGRGLLQRAGLKSFLRFGLNVRRKVYWFCAFDSFHAFRSSTAFGTSWPRRDATPDDFDLGLYDALCRRVFASRWDPARGVCTPINGRLPKRGEVELPRHLLSADEDAAFFVERNPGYLRGDGLPVMVPLDVANWASLGARMVAGRPRVAAPTATAVEMR